MNWISWSDWKTDLEKFGFVWENGDIHQYFLIVDVKGTDEVLKDYDKYWKEKENKRALQPSGVIEQMPQNGLNTKHSDSQILSLLTVHVHPDAVDFLSVSMSPDALQVFPNGDQ